MLLSPSSIYFISDQKSNFLSQVLDKNVLEMSRKGVQSGEWPRLQVVHKDGHYFTLNNAQLQLCRHLEEGGRCRQVRVNLVPLTNIPEDVRKMMVIPQTSTDQEAPVTTGEAESGRTTGRGYQKLDQTDPEKEEQTSDSDSDNYSSSDDSQLASDSECDWSDDDDEDGSGCQSSAGSDQHSSDDERECLI